MWKVRLAYFSVGGTGPLSTTSNRDAMQDYLVGTGPNQTTGLAWAEPIVVLRNVTSFSPSDSAQGISMA